MCNQEMVDRHDKMVEDKIVQNLNWQRFSTDAGEEKGTTFSAVTSEGQPLANID